MASVDVRERFCIFNSLQPPHTRSNILGKTPARNYQFLQLFSLSQQLASDFIHYFHQKTPSQTSLKSSCFIRSQFSVWNRKTRRSSHSTQQHSISRLIWCSSCWCNLCLFAWCTLSSHTTPQPTTTPLRFCRLQNPSLVIVICAERQERCHRSGDIRNYMFLVCVDTEQRVLNSCCDVGENWNNQQTFPLSTQEHTHYNSRLARSGVVASSHQNAQQQSKPEQKLLCKIKSLYFET